MPEETIIEFESVKKGRKVIFFVLIGLFLATTVAFMLLWILKPAGIAVGIQSIQVNATNMQKGALDESGNELYVASVGGTYTVTADVSFVGEAQAETAIQWSAYPGNAVEDLSKTTDEENPNKKSYTFKIMEAAIPSGASEQEIVIRATSPFDNSVIGEFKFLARPNYAAEGKIDSVKLGDRSFTVSRTDDWHYSVEIPYFSTLKDDTNMTTFTVNVAQFAAKALNGEYLQLTRGILGLEGKQVDKIKYTMESSDGAAEIAYSNMDGEYTYIRVLKEGKATFKATLNAYNNGAELPIYLDITVKDIGKYSDVLSSIKFERNTYNIFLNENRVDDFLDLYGEIKFSQPAPTGRSWEYQVYESDISGNAVTTNKRLIVNRTTNDGETVIAVGPVQDAKAGTTYITVRDISSNGYGVYHTATVNVRNPVYSASGGDSALSVTSNGKTDISDYQGETVELNVTYKLRDYDGKLVADNLTTELYFYYTNSVQEPGTSGFANVTNKVTISNMRHAGNLNGKNIYSVSPTQVKISDDGKTATAVIQAKIGGEVKPSADTADIVNINFVTYPQSSHYDPTDLNEAIISGENDAYIKADSVAITILEKVTAIKPKDADELSEKLTDGSRFFHPEGVAANVYRLVRPAGVTTDSLYSVLDLFKYVGTGSEGNLSSSNAPRNLSIEVPAAQKSFLKDGYTLAGSAGETTEAVTITVTLDKGDKKDTYTIQLYYKYIIRKAALPEGEDFDISSTYSPNNDGFVNYANGRIWNFPSAVQFTAYGDKKFNSSQWNTQRYIFIGETMLVKKSASDPTLTDAFVEGVSYYFYLPSQTIDEDTKKPKEKLSAKDALYKMNSTGDIAVNRDLFAFMNNAKNSENDLQCDTINVVYSAYRIEADGSGFIMRGDGYYGTVKYDDYDALEATGLFAGRTYIAHRGLDEVAFFEDDNYATKISHSSSTAVGKIDVNRGGPFTLYPSGIIKYDDKEVIVARDRSKYKGNMSDIVLEKTSAANNIDNTGGYNYNIRGSENEGEISNAFRLYATYTIRNEITSKVEERKNDNKTCNLSLNVLDKYMPVNGIKIYLDESGAKTEAADKLLSADTVLQLVNNANGRKSVTVWVRADYTGNTTYLYLTPIDFGFSATYSGIFTFTTGGDDEENKTVNSGDKAENYRIISLTINLESTNRENKAFTVTSAPRIGSIPNQPGEVTFTLDVTTYTDSVIIVDNEDEMGFGDSVEIYIPKKSDNSGLVEASSTVISVEPKQVGGYKVAENRLKIEQIENNRSDIFGVTVEGCDITITTKGKAPESDGYVFSFEVSEKRYRENGAEHYEPLGTYTVSVEIYADVYQVNIGDSDLEVYVSGESGTTASENVSVSFNTVNDDNCAVGLVDMHYSITDYPIYINKEDIRVSADSLHYVSVIVSNGIDLSQGDIAVTLNAAYGSGDNRVTATRRIVIKSLDKPLAFENFPTGTDTANKFEVSDYTVDSDNRSVNIAYFGDSSEMNFALDEIATGEHYTVVYSLVNLTQNSENNSSVDANTGKVTLKANAYNKFTLTATVTIKASGEENTRTKTLTATVTAYERTTGLTGADKYNDFTLYEYASTEINLTPEGKDYGYTLSVNGAPADAVAISKVSIDQTNHRITLNGEIADSEKFIYLTVAAGKHAADTGYTAPTAELKIAVEKLTEQDKTLVIKNNNVTVDGDLNGKGENTYTVDFATNVIKNLVQDGFATLSWNVSGASGFDKTTQTISVNNIQSGTITVTATVTVGAQTYTATISKTITNDSSIKVYYAAATGDTVPENPTEANAGENSLNIDYKDDNEKFVYAFVDTLTLGITFPAITDSNIDEYFTPYALGLEGASVTLSGKGYVGGKFYAKYSVKPTSFDNLGKISIGGTVYYNGFAYPAPNAEITLTATKPEVSATDNYSAPLVPVNGTGNTSATFTTNISEESGYTAGENYRIMYSLLSSGDINGGKYVNANNILEFTGATENSTAVTFNSKSYVNGDRLVSYTENSIKLKVTLAITKGLYKGYFVERVIEVSVKNDYTVPEFSLKKTAENKYSTEYGGFVYEQSSTGTTFITNSTTLNDDLFDIPNSVSYGATATGLEGGVFTPTSTPTSNKVGKNPVTVTVTVDGGVFNGLKQTMAFDIYVTPKVTLNLTGAGNDRYYNTTAGNEVTLNMSVDYIDVDYTVSYKAYGDKGYITSRDNSTVFVPNINVSGEVTLTAYVTYTSGIFKDKTISGSVTLTVLSASLEEPVTVTPGGEIFTLPELSGININGTISATNGKTPEVLYRLTESAKLTLADDNRTLSAAIDANTSNADITLVNALEIKVEYTITGSETITYIGYADITIKSRPLDPKPTGITVETPTLNNRVYEYSLGMGYDKDWTDNKVADTIEYSAQIVNNVPNTTASVNVNGSTMTVTAQRVTANTTVEILVTATVETTCYDTLTFTKTVVLTLQAENATASISYANGKITVTASGDTVTGITFAAQGVNIESYVTGKTEYAVTAIDSKKGANTYVIATVTFEDGETVITEPVTVVINAVPDDKPTLTKSGSNGNYTFTVQNFIKKIELSTAKVISGKEAIDRTVDSDTLTLSDGTPAADGKVVSKILTFSTKQLKTATDIVIMVTLTVDTDCYGIVTLTKYVTEHIEAANPPTLLIVDNSTAHTIIVSCSDVSIKDISLIFEKTDGLTFVKISDSAFKYTYVTDTADAEVSVRATAVVNETGHLFNGETITSSAVEIGRTKAPDTEPTITEIKAQKTGDATKGTITVTGSVAITNIFVYAEHEGLTLFRDASGDYTYKLVSSNATESIKFTVSATVNAEGNDYYGKTITKTFENVSVPRTEELVTPPTLTANFAEGVITLEANGTLNRDSVIFLQQADSKLTITWDSAQKKYTCAVIDGVTEDVTETVAVYATVGDKPVVTTVEVKILAQGGTEAGGETVPTTPEE